MTQKQISGWLSHAQLLESLCQPQRIPYVSTLKALLDKPAWMVEAIASLADQVDIHNLKNLLRPF